MHISRNDDLGLFPYIYAYRHIFRGQFYKKNNLFQLSYEPALPLHTFYYNSREVEFILKDLNLKCWAGSCSV